VSVSIRPAGSADVDFLVELYADEDVRPFLAAAGSYDRDGVLAKVAQDPERGGVMVVEVEGAQAGAMVWELTNRRSGIVHVSGLAVHPRYRGRRLADEAARLFQRHLLLDLDFHRLQLEIYGFNERAIQHAERSGFVREGVKRKAYWRHGEWADGVQFGLVREDLDA
jgi:RimJ/RimL family protein N-acetyltransferase